MMILDWTRGAVLAALCSVIVVLTGCQTVPPVTEEWPEAAEPVVLLQPGDQLKIRFPYWPELEDEQAIRPDGKIALNLVGDVTAAGKTPDDLRTELMALYEDKIKDPEITVIVKSFDSHRIYVGGEVMRAGIFPLQGKTTILSALMMAGGPVKGSAKLKNVVVVRLRDGKQYAQAFDVRDMIGSPESQAYYLQPNDVVFVPRTFIDQVDQWVDQYINEIIPRNVYMTFTKDVSNPSLDSNTTNTTLQFAP